jgi:signal transduction histidine kinase
MFELEKAVKEITALANKHPSLRETASQLRNRLGSFKNQLEYAQMFIKGVRKAEAVEMSAAGQIRHVMRRFQSFAVDHKIDVTNETSSDCKTPQLPPAVYSGVILNLYTNALKAVLSAASSIRAPRVSLTAWNEDGNHFLEVCDNGVGIPPQLRKRIWDPLYTTTSSTGNPLGSGMGLGLSLVRHVIQDLGGKIELRDKATEGFTTCFRVTFPLKMV